MNDLKMKAMVMIIAILLAVLTLLSSCEDAAGPHSSGQEDSDKLPYAVQTRLVEASAVDPATGIGVYGRYTVLTPAEDAPETFKAGVAACNARAEEAVRQRLESVSTAAAEAPAKDCVFTTYAYIVTVTRADRAVFSLLETEYEEGLPSEWNGPEIAYRFRGTTAETATGD